jgi:hypothetical protein
MKFSVRWQHCLLVLVSLIRFHTAGASESDVHFGLTEWLALQAGYNLQEAETIATGDQRVDSGDIQFIQMAFEYACPGKNYDVSKLVESHHFPSDATSPAPASERIVVAGSNAARAALAEMLRTAPDSAGFQLARFGASLHALQDSWTYQGIPDVPRPFAGSVACNADRVWASPKTRGGWNSHRADLTRNWPDDTLAMARATYQALQQYPASPGIHRKSRDWSELQPLLAGFLRAATKSDKKRWFVTNGITDVSFLQGTSMPDGDQPFDLIWSGRRLPSVTSEHSVQHGVGSDLLEFFDCVFAEWSMTMHFEDLAREFSRSSPPRHVTAPSMSIPELSARFGLWRIRDHGKVADLAHAPIPLTHAQLTEARQALKVAGTLTRYSSAADAFFPVVPMTPEASPLASYVVVELAPSPDGHARSLAAAKFRHAPYDTVAVLAEKIGVRWFIISVDSVIEH